MRTLIRTSLTIPLLCLVALSWSSPAAAQTVPFKVFITELWQLDIVDDGLGYIGDYYAKVTINGVELSNNGACDDSTSTGIVTPFQLFKNFSAISECGARTPWAFSTDVPAGQTVHVKIQVFDSDLVFDDEGDAKPGPGNAIELDVNPTSDLWSGDFSWPQTCSRPNLEGGGNNVNVCWQVGFDSDDDGLLDVWERFGVDTDNDGVINLDLASLGAHPLRKDIFLEVDHLQASNHSHRPQQTAVSKIVSSFANAPVANPDGTTGVQLHVDVGSIYGAGSITTVAGPGGLTGTYGDLGGGNAISEAGNEIIEAFRNAKGNATDFADLKAANFNALREYVFRYTIFGHQTNPGKAVNDCTSGQANHSRRDFLVTLGGVGRPGPCWDTDLGGHSVGSILEQAGTLMHELGHTLGLRHGGDVEDNDKPNYLSVMNYAFQMCEVPVSPGRLPGDCDYSRLVLGNLPPDLVETNLDECVGIGAALGFGAVDWNGNGVFQGESQCGPIFANTTADTNGDGICVRPGANGIVDTSVAGDDAVKRKAINDGKDRVCDTAVLAGSDDVQATAVNATPSQPNTLKSFDDWGFVTPSLIQFSIGYGTGTSGIDEEADPDTITQARQFMGDTMAPAVSLDETGPATARPGDLLTYVVEIANTGRGPAVSAVLEETNPDGASQTSALGILPAGTEQTRTTTFMVPTDACPGDFTGARASMTFEDFVGHVFTAADTVPLQILDVAPPAVEVSLSPAVLWPPNHRFVEVSATITVLDNCDPDPAVTLVSITSSEPETGVIGNGDRGPDIQGAALGTDDRTFELRAERRTGHGSTGRTYTVTYRVTDNSGNAAQRSAIVTVPANNGGM